MNKSRSEFCADYLIQKQAVFTRLERESFDQAERDGEKISCQKSCAYCCSLYVEAMLKECEAIVCYLYQHEEAFVSFLKNYPDWRRETGEIADRCTKALNLYRNSGWGEKEHQDLADVFLFYKLQNKTCPFLKDSNCLIYDARPLTCAAHFVSTPPEWCNPRNPRQPKVYRSKFNQETTDQTSYNDKRNGADLNQMPIKVHEILEKDLYHFSRTGQLPDLDFDAITIERVTSILKTYI